MQTCRLLDSGLFWSLYAGVFAKLFNKAGSYQLSHCWWLLSAWIVFVEWLTDKNVFSSSSNWGNCGSFSPSKTSNTPQAGFEHVESSSLESVAWLFAFKVTITPWRHIKQYIKAKHRSKIFHTILED